MPEPSRLDISASTLWGGLGGGQGGRYPDRFNLAASVSYVTGSHNVRSASSTTGAPTINTRDTNADLQQVYTNGAPISGVASTTRRFATRTAARRPRYLRAGLVGAESADAELRAALGDTDVTRCRNRSRRAGRFIGERRFDAIPMPTWKDFAPRFGVVYDLFGNAKTAAQVRLQPLQRVADDVVRQPLQPAAALTQDLSAGPTSTATTSPRASAAACI